ncbi:MAG: hypothetical protein PVJ67_00010 [Candidatus Pacearchaeota archaeon]|jgi:hypothetical protein
MNDIYLMRLEEIWDLEIEFMEKPKLQKAMILRNRFRNLLIHHIDCPKEEKTFFRKGGNNYSEYAEDELPEKEILKYLRDNPLPGSLYKQTQSHQYRNNQ